MGFFKTNYSKKYNKQKQKITKFLSKKINKYKTKIQSGNTKYNKKLGNLQTAKNNFNARILTHQRALAAQTNEQKKRKLLEGHLKNLQQSNAYKKYMASKKFSIFPRRINAANILLTSF